MWKRQGPGKRKKVGTSPIRFARGRRGRAHASERPDSPGVGWFFDGRRGRFRGRAEMVTGRQERFDLPFG
jgi:hypothetical protein